MIYATLGFAEGSYDFLYLPMDNRTLWNVGYCFINFVKQEDTERCAKVFTGYRFSKFTSSTKVAQVCPAHIQGLKNNMDHYGRTAVQTAKIASHRPVLRPKAESSSSASKAEAEEKGGEKQEERSE